MHTRKLSNSPRRERRCRLTSAAPFRRRMRPARGMRDEYSAGTKRHRTSNTHVYYTLMRLPLRRPLYAYVFSLSGRRTFLTDAVRVDGNARPGSNRHNTQPSPSSATDSLLFPLRRPTGMPLQGADIYFEHLRAPHAELVASALRLFAASSLRQRCRTAPPVQLSAESCSPMRWRWSDPRGPL